MFCGLRMYYADSITLKEICSITYVDFTQTYRLTVAGDYANRNICSATVVTPPTRTLKKVRPNTFFCAKMSD